MIKSIQTEMIDSCQTRINDLSIDKIIHKSFSDLFPKEFKLAEFRFSQVINEPNGIAMYYIINFMGKWIRGSSIMIASNLSEYNAIRNLIQQTLMNRGYNEKEANNKIDMVIGD